ncbi:MAG: hypothetical protein CMO30_08825 [Tistrella sp.]|uniref:hypothetical protein n=1 Tax=Tistrella sp. TaxID=2024861 RepID=UPI000C694B63|nr:hypothetical protein [Tistrella sp.]MAD35238.1 hypothetical protein [Tistrella sp.]MBA75370.1 hypothetical protein [Tistrella sp.]|tara:strand:- start:1075 stop:1524 length:450 start_codon:yes stop_codon:yes gene_type:complete
MDFERWLDEVATERARLNRDVKALVDGHWQTLLQVNAAAREARQKWRYQPRMVLNRSGAFSVVWEEPHFGPHPEQPLRSAVVAKSYVRRPKTGMTSAQFPKAGEGEWPAIAALEAALEIHVERREALAVISRNVIGATRKWRALEGRRE